MKNILTCLVAILFIIGCNDKNKTMTNFIIKKKILEDSVNVASFLEYKFLDSSKSIMHNTHDTLQYYPLADSSVKYSLLGHKIKERLIAIQFSIDSLSKMK